MTFMEIKEFISQLLPEKEMSDYNQYHMSPEKTGLTIEAVDKWNKLIDFLHDSELNYPIKRTKTGAIAKGKALGWNSYAWDYVRSGKGIRITILLGTSSYVFSIGRTRDDNQFDISPHEAWNIFADACFDHGIELDDYAIENGDWYRENTERSPILMLYHMDEDDLPILGANHIDFHNSYPAGLCNTHPEFRPVIEPMYKARKESPEYKAVLNYSIGWMCTDKFGVNRRWAHLRKDAVEDNNKRVTELAARLTMEGRDIIGFNTDGIWYKGEVYHGEGEGPELGQWENDHTNCIFRSKSDGAYEFIEDGIYTPVVRGLTNLDAKEPDRSKWTWGDIYNSEIIQFNLTPEGRLEYYGEN